MTFFFIKSLLEVEAKLELNEFVDKQCYYIWLIWYPTHSLIKKRICIVFSF